MIELIGALIIFAVLMGFSANISVYLYVVHSFASAAREGARAASLNHDLTGVNTATAQGKVKATVKDYIQHSTGILLDDADIAITLPDSSATSGERHVSVNVDYDLPMPLNAAGLVEAFGGSADGLDVIPVHGFAMMRYEE